MLEPAQPTLCQLNHLPSLKSMIYFFLSHGLNIKICCPADGTGLITKQNQRTRAVISPRGSQERSGPLSMASLDSLIASSGMGSSLVPENLREFCPPAPNTFAVKEYQVSQAASESREHFCFLLSQVVQLETVRLTIYVLEDQ